MQCRRLYFKKGNFFIHVWIDIFVNNIQKFSLCNTVFIECLWSFMHALRQCNQIEIQRHLCCLLACLAPGLLCLPSRAYIALKFKTSSFRLLSVEFGGRWSDFQWLKFPLRLLSFSPYISGPLPSNFFRSIAQTTHQKPFHLELSLRKTYTNTPRSHHSHSVTKREQQYS